MTTSATLTRQSLGELVAHTPAAAKVLHRYGLDFCCGGRQTLQEACAAASVDAERIQAEIEAEATRADDTTRWDQVHPSELIEHILTRFHEPLRRELPRLIGLARRTEEVHAQHRACPHGLADVLTEAHEAVKAHLAKEEQILFPMILAGHGAQAGAPIQVMFAEHEEHGANLARIRRLSGDFSLPSEACSTWSALYAGLAELERDLMEHIHLENNILFPRALGRPLGAA